MAKLLLLLAFVVAVTTSVALPQRETSRGEWLHKAVPEFLAVKADPNNCCDKKTEATCNGCVPNPCGKNAACIMVAKKRVCQCIKGFTGTDPWEKCIKKGTGGETGDPHHRTIDGTTFDYQGHCPYIYSKPCNLPKSSPLYYHVKAKNVPFPQISSAVSVVDSIEVYMRGITIFINQQLRMEVNGQATNYPYYYPSAARRWVSVENIGGNIHIKNEDGVEVIYRLYFLNIEVPHYPEYLGKHGLCGQAGNMNGDCRDDVIGANGEQLVQNNCKYPVNAASNARVAKVLDTWITTEYSHFLPNAQCSTGEVIAPGTPACPNAASRTQCKPIEDAINGVGPFAPCSILGQEELQNLYESCAFDTCVFPSEKCNTLKAFTVKCQNSVANLVLPDWRTPTNCPLNCAAINPFSTYSTCIQCEPTCANPHQRDCTATCTEGCKCNPGYLLDTVTTPAKCVLKENCSCKDAQGNYHPPDQTWFTNNCKKISVCIDHEIFEEDYTCPGNSNCGTQNGRMACVCGAGLKWNPAHDNCIPI
ncbi:hypothetical protein L596_000122 [Steinernema carpocapsae]|uniref:VWFD domain-containing protein n=1 Tax=Steinernema carpocapsae TaxID=34508 RepID=A0A4U8UJM2_STECR|nr:hypothetical protein L596_000122 [Steinernema carpocapsae]